MRRVVLIGIHLIAVKAQLLALQERHIATAHQPQPVLAAHPLEHRVDLSSATVSGDSPSRPKGWRDPSHGRGPSAQAIRKVDRDRPTDDKLRPSNSRKNRSAARIGPTV